MEDFVFNLLTGGQLQGLEAEVCDMSQWGSWWHSTEEGTLGSKIQESSSTSSKKTFTVPSKCDLEKRCLKRCLPRLLKWQGYLGNDLAKDTLRLLFWENSASWGMLAKPNAFQWKHCANIYYYLKYLSSTSTFKGGCSPACCAAALQTELFYIHLQLRWTGNWRRLSFEVCKKIQIAT